jgi:hypothetical protein
MRGAGPVLAMMAVTACNRGVGSAQAEKAPEEARRDSAVEEQKALRDSGVTVDTQVIDTGGARSTPAEDN